MGRETLWQRIYWRDLNERFAHALVARFGSNYSDSLGGAADKLTARSKKTISPE